MPFSGIRAGSELEKKIDRCVIGVMGKSNVNKSAAIAICRAAIDGASNATTTKRSRGAAEQRAMFAKMGASGSLQGKGPDGKRTGGKLPPTEQRNIPSGEEAIQSWERQGFMSAKKKDIAHIKNISRHVKGRDRQKMIDTAKESQQKLRADLVSLQNQSNKITSQQTEANRSGGRNRSQLKAKQKKIQDRIDKIVREMRENDAIIKTVTPPRPPQSNFMSRFSKKARRRITGNLYRAEDGRFSSGTGATAVYLAATKRSRGAAEQRAMFAKMGAGGSLQGKGPGGKRTGATLPATDDKQTAAIAKQDKDISNWLDSLDTGSAPIEDQIVLPGRAPRGKGKEYQTRQWVSDRMNKLTAREARLKNDLRSSRNTSRDAAERARKQFSLQAIGETIQVVRHVAQNLMDSGSDFADARSLFSSLFGLTNAQTGVLKESSKIAKLKKRVKVFLSYRRRLLIKWRSVENTTEKELSLSSTHILPPDSIKKIHRSMVDQIDPNDWYTAEDGHGPENNPHVTILFGLLAPVDKTELESITEYMPSFIPAKIGDLGVFIKNNYEVLFLSIGGNAVTKAHNILKQSIPNANDRPVYTPHMTIGYLKKGKSRKYINMKNPLSGVMFISNEIILSGKINGSYVETPIKIKNQPISTKDKKEAIKEANYRNAGPASTRICQTCQFSKNGRCTRFKFNHGENDTCSDWLPDIPALRKRGQQLRQEEKATGAPSNIMAHGPGGLYSTLGLGKRKPRKKRKIKESNFTVYKDASGRSRWVSISSSAFKDLDGEIVSTKALKTAVRKADRRFKLYREKGSAIEQANLKARGPLRWWHVNGLDLGICDFQMIAGRMLIESGTFFNERVAEKVKKGPPLEISIGFKHPETEPDKDGVFKNISIFERSATPQGRAANRFTSLTIKGAKSMNLSNEKLKALRLLLGDAADQIIGSADVTQKSAEAAGVAYKEVTPEAAPTVAELMEVWEAYKTAEAEVNEDFTELWDDEEEAEIETAPEPTTEKADQGMAELKARVMSMEETIKNLQAIFGKRDNDTKKETTDQAAYIAKLEARLNELEGVQPKAMKGYRATMSAAAIQDDAPTGDNWQQRQKEAVNQLGPEVASMIPAAEKFAQGLLNGGI